MQHEVKDFTIDVLERSYTIPVLVDFWAEWCAPCRVLGPVLERLADQAGEQWELVKINTEHSADIAQQYGVQGIPNVKLFVDGEVEDEFVGALPEDMIVQWLQKALPSPYRSQLKTARQLLEEQKVGQAHSLLEDVLRADPTNQPARIFLAQSVLFTESQRALDLVEPVREGSEKFDTAEAIRTLGRMLQLREQPDSLPKSAIKTQYLAALDALQQQAFTTALERFIEVLRSSRTYDDDGARKACIAIFTFLGDSHEITQAYRRVFSSALYA